MSESPHERLGRQIVQHSGAAMAITLQGVLAGDALGRATRPMPCEPDRPMGAGPGLEGK